MALRSRISGERYPSQKKDNSRTDQQLWPKNKQATWFKNHQHHSYRCSTAVVAISCGDEGDADDLTREAKLFLRLQPMADPVAAGWLLGSSAPSKDVQSKKSWPWTRRT